MRWQKALPCKLIIPFCELIPRSPLQSLCHQVSLYQPSVSTLAQSSNSPSWHVFAYLRPVPFCFTCHSMPFHAKVANLPGCHTNVYSIQRVHHQTIMKAHYHIMYKICNIMSNIMLQMINMSNDKLLQFKTTSMCRSETRLLWI